MTMNGIYGLFDSAPAAQRAVNSLRRAGFAQRDIQIISAEPWEECEFAHHDKSLILFRLAALGGVIGLLCGVGITVGTERAWPLNTGGMPIVAWWPNLIVIFELTMLGSILTTVLSLLVTAGLPNRKQTMYDPEVSDGKILVGVMMYADRQPDAVERALATGSPLAVRKADFQL